MVREVATCWNSSYLMLERLVSEKTHVNTVLEDTNMTAKGDCTRLKLTGAQWDMVEDLLKALKPLQAATTALSLEQNASISTVCPIVAGLLNHMSSAEGDSTAIRSFRERVTTDLKERFPTTGSADDCSENVAWLSAAIDPRFKELKFLSPELRPHMRSALEERVRKVKKKTVKPAGKSSQPDLPCHDTSTDAPAAKKPKHDDNVMAYLLGTRAESSSAVATIQTEVQRFLSDPTEPMSTDVLGWWKANEHRFPTLAKVARELLGTPATSTPSERLFSMAGVVCSKKRANILPENLNIICFFAQEPHTHELTVKR